MDENNCIKCLQCPTNPLYLPHTNQIQGSNMKNTIYTFGNTVDFAKTLEQTAPDGCDLKVGDIVTFVNDYGVPFPGKEVIGFDTTDHNLMKYGNFVHIDTDAYWFPHKPSELIKESIEDGEKRLQAFIKEQEKKKK